LTIGEFTADPTSNEIRADGLSTRLRPILMDVLLRLAADAGRVITRDTLLNDVWPRRVINDEVLSRAVAELRTALGDDPKSPRYIETVPKVGYRLIALVVRRDEALDGRATREFSERSKPIASTAETESHHLAHIGKAVSSTATQVGITTSTAPANAPLQSTLRSKILLPRVAALLLIGIAALVALGFYQTTSREKLDVATIDIERRLNGAVPFATSPQSELSPRFAPDGKSVVFVRASESLSEIVIQHVETRSERTFSIPNARLASPVFFPNGKQLAYWIRRSEPIAGEPECAIAMRDLELATDTVLVDCQQRPQPVFDISADGSVLIYSAMLRKEYPGALMQRELKSQITRQLTSPEPGDGHDAYPRISPDGKAVAFFRGTQSHARPWMLTLEPRGAGSEGGTDEPITPRPVSEIKGLSYGMAWLPQGGTASPLVVAADWLGFRALNALSTVDGSAHLLGARGARFPDIAKDGSIVFETATFRADLWLTNAERPGEAARMRWPSTRYTSQPQFSPDGRRVAFASNRSGMDAIHIASIDEPKSGAPDESKRLAFPDDARYIQPRWSPDGSAIFAVRIAAKPDQTTLQRVVSINLATGTVSTLAHLGDKVQSAIPHANGRDIVYGEIAEHAIRLFIAPIAGGAPTRLPLPLVSSFAIVDSDLVYTQPQLMGATHCELGTLKCSPVKADIGDINRFDWTMSKGVLWYVSRSPQRKPQLTRLDLATGEQKFFEYGPNASGPNIAASVDGRWLLVAREAPVVVDLMIAKAAK
jgi:DNA-binding winged helix-turn-helix (wHTH) protein/Tol biopolymer transport system component